MSPFSSSRSAIALFALLVAPAAMPATAATPSSNAISTAAILHPINVIKRADLDFGYVGAGTGAGTVVIDPETDATTSTGGALLLGGTPHSAAFVGAAGSSSVVNIKIPKQPVTLTRVGGTQTMTVSKFTLQGLDKRFVAKQVAFDFRVGATLNVGANQVEGLYTGSFDVTVQYP
ncbi:DUF4402 domain-containing protein [Sphingomonas hankyongi]|uniref:DUF4402 domain-containing protein n=1 Tax=Sphingomonas hankyongi TaxID=2908209 RepID=A0ABT0S532_9SPHN|nr:DUF4402 domain-containing protein [Sphingomonas hankyongi]MCL6730960.1 DUF4402 domain-containing protein [Sphingomonas hankyongi]